MNKQTRTKNTRGFSLVELMVVVAIIGILSAIAIPNYQKFQRKARQSEGKGHMSGLFLSEKAFFQEWEDYSTDLTAIGYSADGNLRYNAGFTDGSTYPKDSTFNTNIVDGKGTLKDACGVSLTKSNLQYNCSFATSTTLTINTAAKVTTTRGSEAFIAYTIGDIGGTSNTNDEWSIDNEKTLVNTISGL